MKTVLCEIMKRNPSNSRVITYLLIKIMVQGLRNRPDRPGLGLDSIFQTNKVEAIYYVTILKALPLNICRPGLKKKSVPASLWYIKCSEISYQGKGQAIVSKSIMAIASKTIFVGVLMFLWLSTMMTSELQIMVTIKFTGTMYP